MRKALVLFVLVVFSATTAYAEAPSNDSPAGATVVDVFPATIEGDTSEATPGPFEETCSSYFASGARPPVQAVWYRLQLPPGAPGFRISQSSEAHVVLWDRVATAPDGTPVLSRYSCAYGDGYPHYAFSDQIYMSVGSVPALGATQFSIQIEIADPDEEPPAPLNDAPYRATKITSLPFEVEQDLGNSHLDHDPQGCPEGSRVWYTYTPPGPDALRVAVSSADEEASVAVYALDEQVRTLGCAGAYGDAAAVETPVDAGVPVLIGVGGYGAVTLAVASIQGPGPGSPDDRADAVPLSLDRVQPFGTTGTTLEVGEPTDCGSGGSTWFTLPHRPRDTRVSITGGASVAAVSGDLILACSTSGELNLGRNSAATHLQVRAPDVSGTIRIGFDPAFGVQVSDQSPFEDDCGSGNPQRNAEVEVSQAVDPHDPDHLVMSWQQDRNASGGGALGAVAAVTFDGGENWTKTVIPGITLCSGGPFPRATDPWAAIDADGTAYVMTLGYDPGPDVGAGDLTHLTNTVLINRSEDGGLTWSEPILVAASPGVVFHDKETLTADPNTPGLLYAVWDAYPTNVAVPVFSRSEDGGRTWTPPVPLPTVGSGAGDQIAVLDDGTLVEIANRGSMQSITSRDRGLTWSRMNEFANGPSDEGPPGVRGGAGIPSVATDGGSVFVSWSDTYTTWFARSDDAGGTWQVKPVGSNTYPMRSTTAVAATDDGTIAVLTYVVELDRTTRLVLATSSDGGETWSEEPVTDSFDMERAPYSSGRGYFLGDYFGLSASGDSVVAALAAVPPGEDRRVSDIYSLKLDL